MKRLIILLLLTPAASLGQSPFDGTWVADTGSAQLPQKPAAYLLAKGMFRCSGCITNVEIEADEYDHKVAEMAYFDTGNVQMVAVHTVEINAKKAGKTMFTEVDAISSDGSTLTQLVKDTTEAETVTTETRNRRVEKGPAGSHAISGSWRAYKINRSRNGSIIKYKCISDGFSAETPLGEKFNAKFDGKDCPVEDDPGHTMAAKLLGPNTVELTQKRNGRIVGISHMSVVPGESRFTLCSRTRKLIPPQPSTSRNSRSTTLKWHGPRNSTGHQRTDSIQFVVEKSPVATDL